MYSLDRASVVRSVYVLMIMFGVDILTHAVRNYLMNETTNSAFSK